VTSKQLNVAGYRFVAINDAEALAQRVRTLAEANGLRGSVLIAPEGINLFVAGDQCGVRAFLRTLSDGDARLQDLSIKESWSHSQPFARLKVKVKDEIIAFRHGEASPLRGRAPSVDPGTLARWLTQGHDDEGRRLVLLDTRNREEIQYGSFADAVTLGIDNFTDLPTAVATLRSDWEDATVVSFCTGGIRCEKAALWMQSAGIKHVVQLEGGILGYFEQVGGLGYDGRCFVFDERVAVDSQLTPMVDQAAT
jgi:UPF0176 protein